MTDRVVFMANEYCDFIDCIFTQCNQQPTGNLIKVLIPCAYKECFGKSAYFWPIPLAKRAYWQYRQDYLVWKSNCIRMYCAPASVDEHSMLAYELQEPEFEYTRLTKLFSIEHGCAVAIFEKQTKPTGQHVLNSHRIGLDAMAEDLTYQALHGGKWPR